MSDIIESEIIETAREKGFEEGRKEGRKEGKKQGLEGMQDMLVDALIEKFDVIPVRFSETIRKIDNGDVLKCLLRQVFKCENLDQYEGLFKRL